MNIVITDSSNDYRSMEEMSIDGKHVLTVADLSECPEDAIIGRDLVSCGDVVNYMELAHKAGKAGEPFEVEFLRETESEE